eukprot:CAMPEP_0194345022 /NCGR_PEP_ID=MMETSP0171-20130528/103943_1 /TAXON_ID=218684 /ORGANISM="Corethron pennatum, Strain L29A3" /LENGTH=306 /DNA_ID=CAMNT_0039111903 /DNA_START=80 /DNA_END=997 /DNA_ORIENTATION=+
MGSAEPTNGWTDSIPTEFCDELLRRGIVNERQCLMSKGMDGATADAFLDARRGAADSDRRREGAAEELEEWELERWRAGRSGDDRGREDDDDEGSEDGGDEDVSDDGDDDAFLARYRAMRIARMKEEVRGGGGGEKGGEIRRRGSAGTVKIVSRAEWTREINDASAHATIVVHLVDPSLPESDLVSDALHRFLARDDHPRVRFVEIPADEAIQNYPTGDLSKTPALFVYVGGTCAAQLVGARAVLGDDYCALGAGDGRDGDRAEVLAGAIAGRIRRRVGEAAFPQGEGQGSVGGGGPRVVRRNWLD